MMFHVILETDESGYIVAECPALPGCISQGKDEREALENIKESIQAWLWAEDQKHFEESKKSGRPSIIVAV
jgi:predicted RNase H-like HicB family nuclease